MLGMLKCETFMDLNGMLHLACTAGGGALLLAIVPAVRDSRTIAVLSSNPGNQGAAARYR